MRGCSGGSASSSSRRCSRSLWRKIGALGARGADAVDHRGVVALVGEDHAALEQAPERAQAGLVGDEARREHERRLLAVEVGELVLELAHEHVRAGDVARPARADAVLGERARGRLDDGRVQAHAEVVVRAPVDDDAAAAVGEPHVRRAGRRALELDEAPVAALLAQRVETAARAPPERPRARDVRRARRPLAATCPRRARYHARSGGRRLTRGALGMLAAMSGIRSHRSPAPRGAHRARARALPRAHAALARARRGGARGADLRRADAVDGEVGRAATRSSTPRRAARASPTSTGTSTSTSRSATRARCPATRPRRRCARSRGASASSAA